MKSLFSLLILCLLTFSSTAGKSFQVEFAVLDSYTSTPLENMNVILVDIKDNTQWNGTTDSKGRLTFNEVTGTKFSAVVQSLEGNFEARFVNFTRKKGSDQQFVIYLYPTADWLDAKWEAEDEKYGTTMEGVLEPSLSTPELFYGCPMEKFEHPMFEGQDAGMQRYISSKVIYPNESIDMNEQGKVYLAFIIEEDGTVSHVTIERGVSPFLDAEAMRLVRIMPKWIPATCDGTAIRSIARLPINFTLK